MVVNVGALPIGKLKAPLRASAEERAGSVDSYRVAILAKAVDLEE